MNQTTEATPCTEGQKAEWRAMHERLAGMGKEVESAERTAVYYLTEHVRMGGLTPTADGLPNVEAVTAYRRACEAARDAGSLQEQWKRLHEESKAHPYSRELAADREAAKS